MEMRDFNVPVIWMMIQLGCVFFTVEYLTRDMNHFGQQIMIRCSNKGHWLLSKYCWNTASVLIYWLTGYIMIMANECRQFRYSGELQKTAVEMRYRIFLGTVGGDCRETAN